MKLKFIFIFFSSLLLLLNGCSNDQPRTAADLDADYRYCYLSVSEKVKKMKSHFNDQQSETMREILTDACLESEKGWDQESLNWALNYQYETTTDKDVK